MTAALIAGFSAGFALAGWVGFALGRRLGRAEEALRIGLAIAAGDREYRRQEVREPVPSHVEGHPLGGRS